MARDARRVVVRRVTMLLLVMVLLLAGKLAAQEPGLGSQAPDLELKDSKGNTFSLSDYRGKKAVVLEFFRSGAW